MEAAVTLRQAREASTLSRRALALRAGTSAATLAAYESGRVNPSVAVFARIIESAGFTPTITLSPASWDEGERAQELEALLYLADEFEWADRGSLRYPILAEAQTRR